MTGTTTNAAVITGTGMTTMTAIRPMIKTMIIKAMATMRMMMTTIRVERAEH